MNTELVKARVKHSAALFGPGTATSRAQCCALHPAAPVLPPRPPSAAPAPRFGAASYCSPIISPCNCTSPQAGRWQRRFLWVPTCHYGCVQLLPSWF